MDIKFKIQRVRRWGKRIGIINAIAAEVQLTLRRPVITITHPGLRRKMHLRTRSTDMAVFEQIFIADEFETDLGTPRRIIDGGANCGLSALYFACRFPDATILAIEPDAQNCEMCRRNTAGLNVEIVQTAMWSSSTYLKIGNPSAGSWSFRCVEAEKTDPGAFEARDMRSLLGEDHCDLLKLDIEGAEVELFRNPDWLDQVSRIFVEIHGEEADAVIREACHGWEIKRSGEKFMISRPATSSAAA